MVRALLNAVGIEVRGLHQAAYLLAFFALLSQILALLRDRLLAGSFGAGETLDLYYAAFRLPDLLFATVASLLSLYALLPVLSQLGDDAAITGFLERMLLVFFIAMGVIAAILFMLVPYMLPLIAPGLPAGPLTDLVRVLLLQPILLGASNIVGALTQLRHRFLLYSLSPLLYNLGIIVGIVFLYPYLGLTGLAWGVVLGAALHLLVQVPFWHSTPAPVAVPWRTTFVRLREVLRLSVPRTLALAAGQLSLLVLVALATVLGAGSVAVFTFAFNLSSVPLAIIGVSYSVAAFPSLSRLHAAGERDEFVRHVSNALRHMLFWAVPAMIFIIVLRAQLVRAILGTGVFDWEETRLVAAALALLVVSLGAQSITLLLARGYYAAGNTAKPLLFAAAAVGTAVVSAMLLLMAFEQSTLWRNFLEELLRVDGLAGTAVLMLALAYCLGALAQAGLGLWYFTRDFALPRRPLVSLFFQSFAAATIGGAAAYSMLAFTGGAVEIDTLATLLLQGLAAGLVGLVVTVATLVLLGNRELAEAYAAFRRRLAPSPVVLETTDVS